MFRKLLRSIMIVLPVFGGIVDSRAETLPQGCFVSDAARIVWNYPPCFNQGRNSYLAANPLNGFSAEQIYSFYGYQYGFEVVASTAFLQNGRMLKLHRLKTNKLPTPTTRGT